VFGGRKEADMYEFALMWMAAGLMAWLLLAPFWRTYDGGLDLDDEGPWIALIGCFFGGVCALICAIMFRVSRSVMWCCHNIPPETIKTLGRPLNK
jgi:cytochrome bd-type quinol oxidase subunit 1